MMERDLHFTILKDMHIYFTPWLFKSKITADESQIPSQQFWKLFVPAGCLSPSLQLPEIFARVHCIIMKATYFVRNMVPLVLRRTKKKKKIFWKPTATAEIGGNKSLFLNIFRYLKASSGVAYARLAAWFRWILHCRAKVACNENGFFKSLKKFFIVLSRGA